MFWRILASFALGMYCSWLITHREEVSPPVRGVKWVLFALLFGLTLVVLSS